MSFCRRPCTACFYEAEIWSLIVWPDRNSIRKHIPVCFRRKYRVCVCIIDCIEIFIERPSKLTAVEISNRHKFSRCSDSSICRLGWSSVRKYIQDPMFHKRQLHVEDIDVSRQLSNVRIYVERVIGRLEKFRQCHSIVSITEIDFMMLSIWIRV